MRQRIAHIEQRRQRRAFSPVIVYHDRADVDRLIAEREANWGSPPTGYGYLILPEEDDSIEEWEARQRERNG